MVIHFLVERSTVAAVEPIEIGPAIGPERKSREQGGGRNLCRPEARGGEACIDFAVGHLVEDLGRQLLEVESGLLEVELKRPTRAFLDKPCELRR
jgi:hypothetical protein